MRKGVAWALLALSLVIAVPQGLAAQDDGALMEARFEEPPPGWEVPRTAWGDPDLRGKWPIDYLSATPRERPANFGTRAFLTDEEYEAAFKSAEDLMERYDDEDKANLMAMGHWNERGHPLRQNSLIVEPANGRYPPLTEEGMRLADAEKTSWNTYVFENMDDFGIFDRCLTRGMPGSMLPGAYNMGIEIHQSPGLVALRLEMIHETRLVYLDGREPPAIRRAVRPGLFGRPLGRRHAGDRDHQFPPRNDRRPGAEQRGAAYRRAPHARGDRTRSGTRPGWKTRW